MLAYFGMPWPWYAGHGMLISVVKVDGSTGRGVRFVNFVVAYFA